MQLQLFCIDLLELSQPYTVACPQHVHKYTNTMLSGRCQLASYELPHLLVPSLDKQQEPARLMQRVVGLPLGLCSL